MNHSISTNPIQGWVRESRSSYPSYHCFTISLYVDIRYNLVMVRGWSRIHRVRIGINLLRIVISSSKIKENVGVKVLNFLSLNYFVTPINCKVISKKFVFPDSSLNLIVWKHIRKVVIKFSHSSLTTAHQGGQPFPRPRLGN